MHAPLTADASAGPKADEPSADSAAPMEVDAAASPAAAAEGNDRDDPAATGPDPRVCKLCGLAGEHAPPSPASADGTAPARLEERLLYGRDQAAWMHLNCMLWSSEVYENDDGGLMALDATLNRGARVVSVAPLALIAVAVTAASLTVLPRVRDGGARSPALHRLRQAVRDHRVLRLALHGQLPLWLCLGTQGRPAGRSAGCRRQPLTRRGNAPATVSCGAGQAAHAIFLTDKRVFCAKHADKEAVKTAVADGMQMDDFAVARRGA